MDRDMDAIEELMMAETPNFNDVMRCVFNIKENDIELYFLLLDHPDSTVKDLANIVGKERSGVHRSLKILRKKGLIKRAFRIIRKGGFTYIYNAIPLENAKKLMQNELKIWYTMMNELVEKFEKNI
ncbi:MAG: helix-turn-helix domain-containing protein [Methanosarcinales archaeon]